MPLKRQATALERQHIPLKLIADTTQLSLSKVKYAVGLDRNEQVEVHPPSKKLIRPPSRRLRIRLGFAA